MSLLNVYIVRESGMFEASDFSFLELIWPTFDCTKRTSSSEVTAIVAWTTASFKPFQYSYLMKGCYLADSITVDGHKNMMTPALTTMLFFKKDSYAYQTFHQEAQYLWGSDQQEWSDAGKRTFECTKLVMSLRIYTIMQQYGIEAFEAYVDVVYDLAREMANHLLENKDFLNCCLNVKIEPQLIIF